MTFKISDKLSLPFDSVNWVFAFLAKRGAGKTYNACVLAEEMLKVNVPIVVIDGMGVWWGLRVAADKEGTPDYSRPGLPVVVFGGEHADLPLIPEKAAAIAKAIVESNISAVIDLSQFSKYRSYKVVADFLNELYRINKGDRHVFIEETDMWAPQHTFPEGRECQGAVDNFVRRGGNKNLGCTLISQRSAVVNKDILTQSDCLVVLRTLGPQDKKAVLAWVESATDEDRTKINKWYESLKTLENGEAWVWHPEAPFIYKRVMFRQRETVHATRKFLKTKQAKQIKLMDVNEFVDKFRSFFEPKPKVQPEPNLTKAPPTLHRTKPQKIDGPTTVSHTKSHIAGETLRKMVMSEAGGPPFVPESISLTTHQTLPTIRLIKDYPIFQVTTEPKETLGQVLASLMSFQGRQDRWTIKGIERLVEDHGWPSTGVSEVITQLLQWEILRKQSNNYLKFYTERVQVVEQKYEAQAQ